MPGDQVPTRPLFHRSLNDSLVSGAFHARHAFCIHPGFKFLSGSSVMRALVWHGKRDVRIDQVPDPRLQEPTDAIVRITTTAICGSAGDGRGLHETGNVLPCQQLTRHPTRPI